MKIHSLAIDTPQAPALPELPLPPSAIADINWFNTTLKPPMTGTSTHMPAENRMLQPLSQRSQLLQTLSNTAARALQKVSSSTDPVDMLTSTRAMSAFHLETVLSAKMISKTSQAIEKLTNLS